MCVQVWDLFMSPGTTRPFPPGEIQEHALPKFPLPDGISTTRLSKAEKLYVLLSHSDTDIDCDISAAGDAA